MRVTLKDIAAKVGVTKTTVSMALRGHGRVSQRMRETIKRVAGEMGYAPDPFLKRLAEYRRAGTATELHGVVAWLNHWDEPEHLRNYHEFEQYWRGAKKASQRLGYQLEEFIWGADLPGKLAEEQLVKRGVLGLLIAPHKPEVDWGDFGWDRFALIRFGTSVGRVGSNLVAADHQRAMVMAVQKIHEYGYRRIGLVYNQAHDRSLGGNYYGGFRWAEQLAGIEQLIPPFDSETKTPQFANRSRRGLQGWMKRFQPDAILTSCPETPLFLRELGYRIPTDVAVASTSPYDISIDTGIDQRPHAIGQMAAEMLIKQISLNERGEPPNFCRILIESRWRDGTSLPPRR